MDLKQIKQIASILKNEQIEEFEWKEGDFYLRLKRSSGLRLVETVVGTQIETQSSDTHKIETPPSLDLPSSGPALGNRYVTSPIVGTFYKAPSPKADPYVKDGDKVNKGQVLCIIEAMKLMNELEAEFPCEIVKIIAGNAQPVEFGEPLFEVKPL
jgi:acetyl-CoA carboxylase biotin carboxyl carrier protein